MKPGKNSGTNRAGLFLGLLFTALFGAAALICAWKVADYLIDARRSLEYWDELRDSVIIMHTGEGTRQPENSPAADTGESAAEGAEADDPNVPAAVDFDALREISADAVAWLYAPGTGINYVVAQSGDNAYYLHRLLDGRSAAGGTLFADYRCAADFSDWNTVIYGHQMKNRTMFGTLQEYRDPAYYEEHPVMYLYVPGRRYKLELIAAYTTDVNDTVYAVPASKAERDALLAEAERKSSFRSGATVGEEDRLVTLSTCSYDYSSARYVVIARIAADPNKPEQ